MSVDHGGDSKTASRRRLVRQDDDADPQRDRPVSKKVRSQVGETGRGAMDFVPCQAMRHAGVPQKLQPVKNSASMLEVVNKAEERASGKADITALFLKYEAPGASLMSSALWSVTEPMAMEAMRGRLLASLKQYLWHAPKVPRGRDSDYSATWCRRRW